MEDLRIAKQEFLAAFEAVEAVKARGMSVSHLEEAMEVLLEAAGNLVYAASMVDAEED